VTLQRCDQTVISVLNTGSFEQYCRVIRSEVSSEHGNDTWAEGAEIYTSCRFCNRPYFMGKRLYPKKGIQPVTKFIIDDFEFYDQIRNM